jgi:exodeoxyribonuclease V beta subunit
MGAPPLGSGPRGRVWGSALSTNTPTTLREFELTGELPSGTTILEASAGTGKTFAIAGLVLRYVVERDIPLPQLLVVTFTRAATAELRDRVRGRFVAAVDHLAAALAGARRDHHDPVLERLAAPDVDGAELRARHARAAQALADFDTATISTIHGFCQQMLRSLGLQLDVDPDAELLADQSELVHTVVDDLIVRYAVDHQVHEVSRRDLLAIADRVVANPDARIVPSAADPTPAADGSRDLPGLRARLAQDVRDELRRRKRGGRVLSYDDLLTRLRDAVASPAQGPQVVAALRARYRVALIDEFQDTDPLQWDILQRAFRHGDGTLVLIGDPKQAIYSFRGADVQAYLAAVEAADHRQTLQTNWRSDGPLLAALDTLFEGATFGDERIRYLEVRPAEEHAELRLTGAGAPLRLRMVPRSHELRASRGDINASAARQHVAGDVAAQAVGLLSSQATIRRGEQWSRVGAGDLAVLVRTNAEAGQVHRALREVRVPAIINGVGSVFDTPAASDWLRLLQALEQPTNSSRARAAALTSFIGWSGEQLATATDDDHAELHDHLHGWVQVLRERGVASLLRTITVTTGLPARLLGTVGGERHLTDLDHVGQLLHRAAIDEELGPASLTAWLAQAITEASDEQIPPEERARRLESDDQAVQILTVHRSKGLQYPIVFAPYLWSPGWLHSTLLTFHDAHGRAVDVGGKRDGDPSWEAHQEASRDELAGEGLRLLYVALTRAEHQVVVWWSPCRDAGKSGLGRLLFARDLRGVLDTSSTGKVLNDDRCRERLGLLVDRSGGLLAREDTDPAPPSTVFEPPASVAHELSAATLGRELDRAWHRTSYSAITARSHQPMPGADGALGPLVASEPEQTVTDDEAVLDDVGPSPAASGATSGDLPVETLPFDAPDTARTAALATPVPLADVPGGAEFGTFVHAVLEEIDFSTADLRGALRQLTETQLERRRTRIGDPQVLTEGLALAVETPLGPLSGGRALREVRPGDRLNELDFELPLDPRRSGAATVGAIADLLRAHVPASDPLSGYAEALAGAGIGGQLRGFLTGSIDLVLRVRDVDAAARYLVVDHKTNRLGTRHRPLTVGDYAPAALTDAMVRGHYPLQALLYQVALHRYLRWRVPDHAPTSLGGALYLFLRGMAGTDTPMVGDQPCGVFAWHPPADLIVATSDLLDGVSA